MESCLSFHKLDFMVETLLFSSIKIFWYFSNIQLFALSSSSTNVIFKNNVPVISFLVKIKRRYQNMIPFSIEAERWFSKKLKAK